jgi:DNA polymerase elongation subunit (family B)
MNSLEFQLYDWLEDHDIQTNNSDCEGEENGPGNFIIHSFGRCDDGKSVYAKITGYTPYFYILLPDKLQNKSKSELDKIVKNLEEYLKSNENKKIFYKFKSTLIEMQVIKLKKAEGFTNNKEFYFVRLVFNNADGMKKYRYLLEGNDVYVTSLQKPVRFKLFEANLPPMLRCFHIREISGCSWIETSKYNLIENEDDKESRCDIEINVDWRNFNPIMKDHNAPFRICSFDIECNSIDGEFPQARRKGDCVIQIGATYNYIGKSDPYRQYIACLNETSPLDGIIVDSCKTEQELMLKFLDEINTNDADIITGYNIFFFDEKYMYDRCREVLKIEVDMSFMSKLKNFKCNFKEMKLASSALGENLLRFWDTPGRVHIDLMKDVQKTFNLTCYKLDYVASKFIRGDIESFKVLENDQFELKSKSVQDIYIGDYIHLEVIKGFVSDEIGDKYLVLNINSNDKTIIVKGDQKLLNDMNEAKLGGTIHWSQAKDDVGPKDIFRLQKGSPDDRAIVAKYCVKDCKLVNLLMNKLEVVTKNIEMANVCFVPLSYLFIRGQGIKGFSLTLREYRKQKYAFPVIKMDKYYKCLKCRHEYLNLWSCPKCRSQNRDEIESDNTSYEGAIVFDPVPQVDYEALCTKDYASLYPSSAIHKNMSHETIIEDDQYDNLPGIEYYNSEFKEADGSTQYRRYAKVNGKLGVVPTILDNLLKERKKIKKLMKNETDQFKYKILDAKQLAVKVTANSLYGQLGAQTSSICKRDIAACITSTGREMLILAKKYDEEYLPWIMNGLKYFYVNNELDKVEHLYDLELKARKDTELIENIKKYVTIDILNITIQPVIRYGDTDSIFSCYRFRENTTLVDEETGLYVWKNIIRFGKELIEPYFGEKERKVFNDIFNTFYSDDKITELKLPGSPKCQPPSTHNAIVLPLDERLKQFVKEYMEESYIPWLWTLSELVEKNYTNMFDIKLKNWAEHQLIKIRLVPQDLYDNRKNYLLYPAMEYIKQIFDNNYVMPSDNNINEFANKLLNEFSFNSEIKIKIDPLKKLCKTLMEKTIKDKWIFSGERKEITKIINDYLNNVCEKPENVDLINHYITNFIGNNKNMDLDKMTELLIKNLLSDQEMGCIFDQDKLNQYTKDFIENYNKNNGKKTLEEIMYDFFEKDLGLNFNLYKENHYNKVISFVNNYMRFEDMSEMTDTPRYIHYWLQPRWDFDENKNKIYKCDIYQGGSSITDKRTLEYGITMGELSGELIKSHLPFPHDCEYEKTFWPFAILTKKRYVGNKYEFDPKKFKQDFMGIVLKRRDNSAIVKEICGGIINLLINDRNPQGAKDFTRKCLKDMFEGKYDIKYFLQSRNLKMKESYKDWKKIAHVYLGEKIAQRDPGNAPQSGDRIEFAIIKVPIPIDGKKLLQGDIIETPKFIKDNNLEIDYLFYLTNQIMNPALQFLELVDKNAINIFKEFIDEYSIPKIKKVKVIKEVIPKIKKIKVAKEVIPKITKKKSSKVNIKKYIVDIKNLIDEIEKFSELNKYKYKDQDLNIIL